ncbi:hypothetical protein [Undibacter mobilis]|uniref:Uncharacterized protein n=1 Tax=Undibacter mobilis TaxID=2292256 RepID=A0A371B130_9BRAD|nr:hypothetical protein [Undibacter mobilis]RDV01250.1 hypothetical protein DXH78_18640 [Undibacter mobilis]
MTKLQDQERRDQERQDQERSAKTMVENQKWLDKNVDNVVRASNPEAADLDRWNADGGSPKGGDRQ